MKKIISTFLLLLAVISISAQPYSKELEKAAKNGDPVAQRDLGLCYFKGKGTKKDTKKAFKWLLESSENGNADAMYCIAQLAGHGELSKASVKIPDVNERGASEQLYARFMYEKAAELGQPNALVWLGRDYQNNDESAKALECYKRAASCGNHEAEYLLGFLYHYGIGTEVDEVEAKRYFTLAANGGREEAIRMVDEIHRKEIRDSLNQVRSSQEEAKRKEERRLAAEREARKKKLDSIAAKTGLPASYTSLICQCTIIPRYSDDWRGHDQVIRQFQALCSNNLLKYYGKDNLSGLDKALYMKSEEYPRDKRVFEEMRNSRFAICIRLGWEPYGWTGPDTKPYFEGNGFGFYTTISNSRFIPSVKKSHVIFGENGIPVRNCVLESSGFGQKLFFGCNDLEKLQYIRDNYSDIDVVFVFKPSIRKNLPSELIESGIDYFIGSTIGIYVYNVETDELILDLSRYGRNIDSQVEKQKEDRFFNEDKARVMAEKSKQKNKKYHSTLKKERCPLCWGTGTITQTTNGVTHRERCYFCYGKGYTEEHNY